MSTRHLAPVAQYREPRNPAAAAVLSPAYLVLSSGRYTASATGPADAFFSASSGRLSIDSGATAHATGVRLTTQGTRISLYGTPA